MMASGTELRRVGIGPMADMPWGTHMCTFFETTEDLLQASALYFKAGLESKEYCIWAVSGRLTRERATTALRQALPDLDRHLAERSLDIISAREWYLDGGRLDLRRIIRGWRQRLRFAETRGYAGLRVAGGAAWLETRKEWRDFLEYEATLNEAFRNRRIIALCSYGLRASGAADLLDVARAHQFAIARRTGAWHAVAWRDLERSPNGYASLTPREREVLHLVAAGGTSSEIGGRLSISVRTVEVHRSNLMRKLRIRNQAELVRYAVRQGLSSSDDRPR